MKINAKSLALLYRTGKINIDGVRKALEKGWITPEEFYNITGVEA